MKKSPKRISSKECGTIAETAAATALLKEGFGVSFAHGDNLTWDLVTDWEGKITRVQVKTASKRDNYYHVNVTHGKGKLYSAAHCDCILVYLPYSRDYQELTADGIYLLPVESVRKVTLNFWPPGLGNQKDKMCSWERHRDAFDLLR